MSGKSRGEGEEGIWERMMWRLRSEPQEALVGSNLKCQEEGLSPVDVGKTTPEGALSQ